MNALYLAHKGFYNPESRGEYAGCNLGFSNDGGLHFISYSTTIARVVTGRDGQPITLISTFNYSMTTAKHISYVRQASPYPVLYLPHCEYDALSIFREELQSYIQIKTENSPGINPERFLQKEARRCFMDMLEMFDDYQERVGGLDELLPMREHGAVACWERLCLAIDGKTMPRKQALEQAQIGLVDVIAEQRAIAIEREKARKKKEANEKRKRTMQRKAIEKKLSEVMENIDLLRLVYTYQSDLSHKEWEKKMNLKEKLNNICYTIGNNGKQYASYVWKENEQEVETSQGITVSLQVVKRLLSMWKNKQNILGESCDKYKVVMNNEDFVKVGCHVIPIWNVLGLCKQLNIE